MALKSNLHEPRILPVLLLCDTSGSMGEHGKIETLNLAVREMLGVLASNTEPDVQIKVAVISFGGAAAKLHLPLTEPDPEGWSDLTAAGGTPLGAALDQLVNLTEDRTLLPENAYQPTVLLVSDGLPTDNFDGAFARFTTSAIGTRSIRLAIRIGADANDVVLKQYAGSKEAVLSAANAVEIDRHFRFVTYTVMTRAKSSAQGTTDMPTLRQFGSSSGPLF